MGYRVAYSSSQRRNPDSGLSVLRIILLSAALFTLFSLFICSFWPQGREVFAHLLFPGGVKPAMAAADMFVAELRCGENLCDALAHFCREIIANAHLS